MKTNSIFPATRNAARHGVTLFTCGVAGWLGVGIATASAGDGTARWSWQEPHAKGLPTGDLEWAPRPFEFKPGESIRYIDFESGTDANDGLSKQNPWKHHPWDPDATDKAKSCKGAHTYVFKQLPGRQSPILG